MRSPILWFGGKGNMSKKLIDILKVAGKHHIYVEPFGGGASLLFAKEPSPVEVYNDLDSGLVNFFRVLRDKDKFQEFYRLVSLTPYSREEYYDCRNTWNDCEDDVERAYRWFVVARMSFAGACGSGWGYAVTSSARGMSSTVSKWLSTIDSLPEIHARLMRVQIEHHDFRKIFETYDTPKTLFYCDPPYISATRKNGEYKHETTDKDHRDLVDILLGIKGNAILSGYRHEIYSPLEDAGWRRYDFSTVCHAAGRTRATGIQGKGSALKKQPRTESVWIKKERTPVSLRSANFFAEKT